jgi:hypothetical protein
LRRKQRQTEKGGVSGSLSNNNANEIAATTLQQKAARDAQTRELHSYRVRGVCLLRRLDGRVHGVPGRLRMAFKVRVWNELLGSLSHLTHLHGRGGVRQLLLVDVALRRAAVKSD